VSPHGPTASLVVGLVEDVEIVLERPHPRIHLLFLGPGKKSDVFAHRHGDGS
jgi:hypothetical protein